MLKGVRKGSESKDVNLNDGSGDAGTATAQATSHCQEKATAEPSTTSASAKDSSSKPKTSQSDTSHGSFFLRMGTLGMNESF